MRKNVQQYIDGEWINSTNSTVIDVISQATVEVFGEISDGMKEDVDKAVKAARKAFPSFSTTTVEERIALLNRIAEEYEKRKDDIVRTVTAELGVPLKISEKSHY